MPKQNYDEVVGEVQDKLKEIVRQFRKAGLDYKIAVQYSRDVQEYGTEGGFDQASTWDASWC